LRARRLDELRHVIEHDLEHEKEHEIERAKKEAQIVKHLARADAVRPATVAVTQ